MNRNSICQLLLPALCSVVLLASCGTPEAAAPLANTAQNTSVAAPTNSTTPLAPASEPTVAAPTASATSQAAIPTEAAATATTASGRSTRTPTTAADSAPQGTTDSFQIKMGESAAIGEAGLRITFDAVTEDSRCPTTVECVWAGQATVRLIATTGEQADGELLLTISPGDMQAQAAKGQLAGYTLSLTSLEPYPKTPGDINPADYVATIAVGTTSQ